MQRSVFSRFTFVANGLSAERFDPISTGILVRTRTLITVDTDTDTDTDEGTDEDGDGFTVEEVIAMTATSVSIPPVRKIHRMEKTTIAMVEWMKNGRV